MHALPPSCDKEKISYGQTTYPKRVFFTNQLFHLKKGNPKQWYREVMLLTGMNDSPLKLIISNCAPDDDKGIANAINQKDFSGEPDVASSEYHCITCIPARSRNQIKPWEVYNKMCVD